MKHKKKMIMALCFCLGVVLFVSAAFADVSAKTGYDQLKDALKCTDKACGDIFSSYTIDNTLTINMDDRNGVTDQSTVKIDNVQIRKRIDTNRQNDADGVAKPFSHFYFDRGTSILAFLSIKYAMVEIYDHASGLKSHYIGKKAYNSIFGGSGAEDTEKIADILFGNLKDYVTADMKPDGGKEISVTANDNQIPVFLNALASYWIKRFCNSSHNESSVDFTDLSSSFMWAIITNAKDDLSIKSFSLKAAVRKDGILQDCSVTVVFSCKDEKGSRHEITACLLNKLSDINATTFTKPDLAGMKVYTVK